ncbi:MAG TPA: hydrogenase [Bacteroidetes bacterium]|nr:hydrogenase [Bacteroidota bacterium]
MKQQELSYGRVNDIVLQTLEPPRPTYYLVLLFLLGIVGIGASSWAYQILRGMGVAGINNPVGWGVYITDFVFWVGIAHSGTLISAILYLFRARWRTSIYRSAEAMTVFAVLTAGLFPLIHLGRVWFFYWLFPYPNQRFLWPNFRSPLILDVLAVSTYLTVSSMFFFIGMIPDIAAARDRAVGLRKKLYTLLSFGWKGTHKLWHHYGSAYLFFAALATPLVISVHSVVSWDFALSIIPGWHSTIFAPYFVAGAIHSGLAMVITILIPLRKIFKVEELITKDNLESMAKMIVLTGLIVGYAYATEFFMAWYSGNQYEYEIFRWRAAGDYAIEYWIMVIFNSVVPLLFFVKKIRRSIPWLLAISIAINIGMWFERYVIIVTSLAHDFLPYSWGHYRPSLIEFGITLGSFGWFFLFFFIFAKLLPSVSIAELKEMLPLPRKSGGKA